MTEQSKSLQEVYMYAQDTLFRNTLGLYITVFVCFTELALACGHFSTSLHLCVNQDDAAAVAFSKLEFTK